MLKDAENLKQVGAEYSNEDTGTLTIATTHTQARYALPAVAALQAALSEGAAVAARRATRSRSPSWSRRGDADIAIETEPSEFYEAWCSCRATSGTAAWSRRRSIRCSRERRSRSKARRAPDRHLRLRLRRPLADQAGLRDARPQAERGADRHDSDVIKTYVELGLGVGILAKMAFDPARDTGLAPDRREPSVRAEHCAHRHQPQRLPARLRLRLHRAVRAAPEARVVEATQRGEGTSYEL